jgi:hypothetical protein
MADLCCAYSFAGITINDPTDGANHLMLGENGVTGLDGAPIRAEIDDQGQSHGGIVHPKWFGARIITFTGFVNIQSTPKERSTAYFTAINVLEAAVIAALEGVLNTPTSLSWTPTGGSGKSISCTYGNQGGEIQFGGSMLEPTFAFTLVAENPTIS